MDMIAYVMGIEDGKRRVELSGDIVCTDDGEGNVEVKEVANDGE